jgi:hypothetical protein
MNIYDTTHFLFNVMALVVIALSIQKTRGNEASVSI